MTHVILCAALGGFLMQVKVDEMVLPSTLITVMSVPRNSYIQRRISSLQK